MLRVHVGQAGGQAGVLLAASAGAPAADGYGCVFVDSEPKVVAPLLEEGASRIPWLLPTSVVYDHNGRGNNWAWGYNSAASRLGVAVQPGGSGGAAPARAGGLGCSAGKAKKPLIERALESIRRNAECMDRFSSVLLVRSIGGGTGSGLGSRILEAVRDAHPTAVLLDAVIAPFAAGDTPTQHYNTILALAWSQRHADATLHFGNDEVLARAGAARRSAAAAAAAAAGSATPSSIAEARARGLLSERGGSPDYLAGLHTRDLNTIIAEALSAVVLPMRTLQQRRSAAAAAAEAGSGSGSGSGARGLTSRRLAEAAASGSSAAAAAAAAVAAARPVWQDTRDPATLGDPHAKAFTFASEAKEAVGEGEGGREEEEGEEEEESEFGARGGWIAAAISSRPSTTAALGSGSSAAARNLESILGSSSSGSSSGSGSGSGSSSTGAFLSAPLDIVSLLNAVAPSPQHKFLDVRSVRPPLGGSGAPALHAPSATFLSLSEALLEVLPRYDAASRNVTTRAACLLVRGASAEEARSCGSACSAPGAAAAAGRRGAAAPQPAARRSPPSHASMAAMPPMWPGLPMGSSSSSAGEGGGLGDWERVSLQLTRGHSWAAGSDLGAARSARVSEGGGRSLTCVGNSDAFVAPLVRSVARADALLAVGAYVHWYARHGVEREDIMGAMHDMLDVVEAYRPPGGGGASVARRGGAAR